MPRRNFNDLRAFLTVARVGNFTRSANALGITQSALSQAIKTLEEQLDLRLFTRTTRSVSLTQAGERLFEAIGGRFDEIDAELDALTAMRDKPAGLVRITTGEHAMRALLLPKLTPLMQQFPDIRIEFDVSYGLRDIAADRFDAGDSDIALAGNQHALTGAMSLYFGRRAVDAQEFSRKSEPPGAWECDDEALLVAGDALILTKGIGVGVYSAAFKKQALADAAYAEMVASTSCTSWLFAGSDRGGQRAAAMYSLIVTTKMNDIDPQAWLADVLARIAGHPASRIDDLLPWNWRPAGAALDRAA